MLNSLETTLGRRSFLALLSAAAATGALPQAAPASSRVVPGKPGPDKAGPISVKTIAEAEKLAGVSFTPAERTQLAKTINDQVEGFASRLEGVTLPEDLFPATTFNPVLPNVGLRPTTTTGAAGLPRPRRKRLPGDAAEIGFASIAELSHWIHSKQISCVDLAKVYLQRLKKYDTQLKCVITLNETSALRQAKILDRELADGNSRGPLHGIPWGAKDLLDTEGIKTTFGAAPFKDRVPDSTAEVVKRLDNAGAVLIAKLTLGALAYGDIWFGGRTNSPWDIEQGSSGSSAGPAAATAAGLVGFAIGSETCGSIISPCQNCGVFGLRPTFGRVPRDGAMALCWTLDKLGPICRNVDDLAPILAAINGASPGDPDSVTQPFHTGAEEGVRGLRVGYDPTWFDGIEDPEMWRVARESVAKSGATLVKITMPDMPWGVLFNILLVEAASAFESITRDDSDDQLKWQAPEAWPNTFRQSWFIPAPEYVQAQRFRRRVMQVYADIFDRVDALLAPPYVSGTLIATNCTGHPALACPIGVGDDGLPRVAVLMGRLFDEGTLLRLGGVLEARAWARRRPPLT